MVDGKNPLSAGIIVVRFLNGKPHYLLLQVFGNWDFPKGLVETGEKPLDAAIREVKEETTLTDLHFHWGYEFRETLPFGKFNKIARYYLAESKEGEIDLPVSEELGHPEHEEFCWLTFTEAMDRIPGRVKSILEWASKQINS